MNDLDNELMDFLNDDEDNGGTVETKSTNTKPTEENQEVEKTMFSETTNKTEIKSVETEITEPVETKANAVEEASENVIEGETPIAETTKETEVESVEEIETQEVETAEPEITEEAEPKITEEAEPEITEEAEPVDEIETENTEDIQTGEANTSETKETADETGDKSEEVVDATKIQEKKTTENKKKSGKRLIELGIFIIVLAAVLVIMLFGEKFEGINFGNKGETQTQTQQEVVQQENTPVENIEVEEADPAINTDIDTSMIGTTKFIYYINNDETDFNTKSNVACHKNNENTNWIEYSGMSTNMDFVIADYGYKVYEDDVLTLYFNNMYSVKSDTIGTDTEGNEYIMDTVHIILMADIGENSGSQVELNIHDIMINGENMNCSSTSTFDSTSSIEFILLADNDDINTNGISSLTFKADYNYNNKSTNAGEIDIYEYADDLIDFEDAYNNMITTRTEEEQNEYARNFEIMEENQKSVNGGYTDNEVEIMYNEIKTKVENEKVEFNDVLNTYIADKKLNAVVSNTIKKLWETETGEKQTYENVETETADESTHTHSEEELEADNE